MGRNSSSPFLVIELDAEHLADLLMKHSDDWYETLKFLENLSLSRSQALDVDTVSNIIRAEYEKE